MSNTLKTGFSQYCSTSTNSPQHKGTQQKIVKISGIISDIVSVQNPVKHLK